MALTSPGGAATPAAGALTSNADRAAVLERLAGELAGQRSEAYFRDHRRRYARDLEHVAEVYPGRGRVLEVGSFPGHVTSCLAGLGVPVTGVDIAPERVAPFLARHGLEVLRCDVEREPLPFPDATFVLVLLHEVFEHLRIDPIFALREIRRVLSSDGVLVLTTPNLYALRNVVTFALGRGLSDPYGEFLKLHTVGHMGHVREYAPRELRRFLAGCGFEVLRVRYLTYNPSRVGRLPDLVYRALPPLRPYQVVDARPDGTTGRP